ncbi:MAG: hypothetical protein K8S54_09835 [Spirochaetia bacterium]|nr:hypothetical protein [Spirochaetia bacterium]
MTLALTACSKPIVNEPSSICTISENRKSFVCDIEFAPRQGKCTVDAAVRSTFVSRMTSVSLEMLYLEREPGGAPPYRYNDLSEVLRRVNVGKCSGSCACRLSFEDAQLDEIFYDSAGCRNGSKLRDHPLYFRGRGCKTSF